MWKRLPILLLFLGVATVLGGCHRALFPANNEHRTQFDSYDTIRHGPMITLQPNEYGLPEPAIRNRLGRHRR